MKSIIELFYLFTSFIGWFYLFTSIIGLFMYSTAEGVLWKNATSTVLKLISPLHLLIFFLLFFFIWLVAW